MAPQQLPPDIRARFPTAIADVETTGNSGSGVFDASKGCLLGIVSRRIDVVVQPSRLSTPRKVGLAKYFVPVAVIGPFLAEIFQP
jgi:hypothetical protein